MKKINKISFLLGILLIIIIWTFLACKNTFFPSILQVFNQFCTKIVDYYVLNAFFSTVFRSILSFLISLLVGYIFAFLSYKSKFFKELIFPLISLLRSIPTISIIIIVLMIVDLKLISYTIVSIIIFPIIYQNILYSFETINNELIMINKLDNTNPFKNFILFIFPLSLNGVLNAILQTLGLSIKIQVMSEILTGSTKLHGIGLLINNYRTNLEIDSVFAVTLMIIIFVFLIEYIIKLANIAIKDLT